ncbi:hypothetical protein M3649_02900 [Ureibacillus chungkukjangi]|uniref:hypothetical protein n=1 Tax=Ureibacillus chungkukjangi TaxID=1202712 RepID=UPI00203F69E5|nr:hypothetical protein [Ureibacillus chungkukjangi]MCM3387078.1 hypothetical protein [Ureibacillus chungkukjangi]
MGPAELIGMLFSGAILIIVLVIIWFIFRKKKKIALTVTIISVLAFILFFSFRPSYVKIQHAKRYIILVDYLQENYPKYEFEITPKILEEGYQPYEYRVVANGYKYRNEYYKVDSNHTVTFTSYSTMDKANKDEIDQLLFNSVVIEAPFEYLEKEVKVEEIANYEEDTFLVRLVLIEGNFILANYLINDGQYFLQQWNFPGENNTIEIEVSPSGNKNYYVMAALPGFDKEHWKTVNPMASKIQLTEEIPAIYVISN